MQVEIQNNFQFNNDSREQALHNQQLRAVKRPSSNYIKQKSLSDQNQRLQLRLSLIDHVNNRTSFSADEEKVQNLDQNSISQEQKTRAQKIPQSMELSAIKDLKGKLS